MLLFQKEEKFGQRRALRIIRWTTCLFVKLVAVFRVTEIDDPDHFLVYILGYLCRRISS